MPELVVIREEVLIVMHMMRCTIILDPDSFDSPDISINCRLEAKRESAEYRVVCRSVAINTAIVGIGVILPLPQPPLFGFWAFAACFARYSSAIRL